MGGRYRALSAAKEGIKCSGNEFEFVGSSWWLRNHSMNAREGLPMGVFERLGVAEMMNWQG